jgi:hypothetical protein
MSPGTGPLLIDRIPGEDRDVPFAQVGQGLATVGFIALLAGILAVLLSGPSLQLGWEGSWYIPRGEMGFGVPMSLALMVAGVLLHIFGRRTRRQRPAGGGLPPGRDRTGTGR